ncbi:MAG: hypothetical protein ACRENP_23270 [Longimicrobiales bacterium]
MIAILQTDPVLLERLGRIASAQTILSVVAGLFALLAVGAGILSYKTFKTLARTLRSLERVIDQLAPRAEPLIDGVTRIAVDAGEVTSSVRKKVSEVLETVDDVNIRLRDATDAAEQRVRQFGAVLDVVQAEAEELLLDAAATARGVHSAARTLREPARDRRRRLPRPREDVEDDE